MNDWTIFYSWQSDLLRETNQKLIRKCLREASNLIETENDLIRILNDEATRNVPGSPDIPAVIFDKIDLADIFICDITTINGTTEKSHRKTPNPNVLIELGFAIANLGWDRIILVFNLAFGDFPKDIPFDIGKRRVLTYNVANKSDKNGQGQLRTNLRNAIESIINTNPVKRSNSNSISNEEKRRERTVVNLRWILSNVHFPTIDLFLEDGPLKVNDKIFLFWHGFEAIYNSSLFYIYDEELRRLFEEFHESWKDCMSKGYRYFPISRGGGDIFRFSNEYLTDKDVQKDLDFLRSSYTRLSVILKKVVKFIMDEYIEIDLEETSRIAFQKAIELEKDVENLIQKK